MLNKYEYVIKSCDFIEKSLLDRSPFIAPYESFNDKLSQLKNRIPSYIMTHLHTIRQQRNYLAHNQEHRFQKTPLGNKTTAITTRCFYD